MFNVAVIGAGGHVGLPFAIVNALAGNKVIGVDINEEFVLKLNDGKYPYVEEAGDEGLEHVLKSKKLYFTTSQILPKHIDVIAIMIGTPVDSENNPRLDYLMNYVDDHLIPHLSSLPNDSYGEPGPLIVLRSTVAPGTTELLQKKLNGYRCQLVFCPERVVQGKSLIETSTLPQIVGAFSQWDFETASKYFGTFNNSETIYLSPREAEVAKLITNMTRYVNFALANEFYMIGDQQGIDIHRVIDAANKDYPRLDLPKPGPNVGGPCLEIGSRINTPKGFKNIEDLKIGDEILDGKGLTIVTDFQKRSVDKSTTLFIRGLEIKSSEDHLHLVSDTVDGICKETFAKDIKAGQYVYIKRPSNENGITHVYIGTKPSHRYQFWIEEVEIDNDWARIIGLWLAEGHRSRKRVYWSFGLHEEELVKNLVSLLHKKGLTNAYYYKMHTKNATYGPSTVWRIRVDSIWLNVFFDKLDMRKGSKHKQAPDLAGETGLAMIGGWLDGDGCQSQNFISGYSRSSKMIKSFRHILMKHGILARINHKGESLVISMKEDILKIIPFTQRFNDPKHYTNLQQYESPDFRKIENGNVRTYKAIHFDGWMVKIKKVVHKIEDIDVVGIETTTGKYLVENIETHNCLFKDGRFLLKSVPFVDLIQTAFVINEGMPQYVFNRMMEANPNIKSVRIYGMTFKANNDDIRNSLSFKFKKICEQNGLIVEYTDPYYGVKTSGDIDHKKDVDALVIMTPHDEYKGLFDNKWNPPKEGQVLVDVWKIGGKLTKGSHNGIAVVKNR